MDARDGPYAAGRNGRYIMGPEDQHEQPFDPEAYDLWMTETRNAAILDEIEKLSNVHLRAIGRLARFVYIIDSGGLLKSVRSHAIIWELYT